MVQDIKEQRNSQLSTRIGRFILEDTISLLKLLKSLRKTLDFIQKRPKSLSVEYRQVDWLHSHGQTTFKKKFKMAKFGQFQMLEFSLISKTGGIKSIS